jgi:hypothetical protein
MKPFCYLLDKEWEVQIYSKVEADLLCENAVVQVYLYIVTASTSASWFRHQG